MKKTIYPISAALVIAADQITKYLVRANMQPGERIHLIGERLLSLYYVQNTGTAFSMFSGNKLVTVVLTSALIIVCLVLAIKEYRGGGRLTPLLLTFVASGGISNMIDRLTLGFVTDMISCLSFAVFNVADIFITCGCALIMISILISLKNESKSENGGSDER